MKPGDKVSCVNSYGYMLTEGKHYTIVEYDPPLPDEHFTWPAYVRVLDDRGQIAYCHASRFKVVP